MKRHHKTNPGRRIVLAAGGYEMLRQIFGATSLLAPALCLGAGDNQDSATSIESWMEEALSTRGIEDRLNLSRFVEPVYYLTEPTSWAPNAGENSGLARVTVPKGFVTDFASIPRVFYSLLRPDGEYAHAALIHDYLYWVQSRPKNEADTIFRIAMQDLEVTPIVVAALHEAVVRFGARAWAVNGDLRRHGERRVLRQFPVNANTRWAEWKKIQSVFSEI